MYKFIILLALISCSTSEKKIKKAELDTLYIPSNNKNYFLRSLPQWANFSEMGSCHLSGQKKYLDFESLSKEQNLDYVQLGHLQHMYNVRLQAVMSKISSDEMRMSDEINILNDLFEQVKSKQFDFATPEHERVHIVWIDDFVTGKKNINYLKGLFRDEAFLEGYPILFSLCLNQKELDQFIVSTSLDEYSPLSFSNEYISAYQSDLKLGYSYQINLIKMFEGKSVHFFSPREVQPKFLLNIETIKTF